MEKFTYYQIYYINSVTKRPYKTKYIFSNEQDCKFCLSILLNSPTNTTDFFYKEITIPYYKSISQLIEDNRNENLNK